MDIMYMRGTSAIAVTRLATVIPRVGDKVQIGDRKLEIAEIIWHVGDHHTWIEVQI